MRTNSLKSEAELCRRQATAFSGKPEQRFLLRLAEEFDDLAGRQPT